MRRALIATTIVLTVFTALVAIPQSQAGAQPQQTQHPTAAAKSDPCRPGDAPCWRNHINRRIWMAEVARQQRYARLLAYAAAVAASRAYPHGLCGGDLPPCYVMRRESGGNITAQNPRSTASGKWQVLDSTWRGYGGVRKARYASERVQDDFARRLWNHGRGCSHWSSC